MTLAILSRLVCAQTRGNQQMLSTQSPSRGSEEANSIRSRKPGLSLVLPAAGVRPAVPQPLPLLGFRSQVDVFPSRLFSMQGSTRHNY